MHNQIGLKQCLFWLFSGEEMQSTKEEYPLSIGNSPQTEKEALLLLHQKRLLSQHQQPERILQTG